MREKKRMRTHETNWAGNYTYTAAELAHPRSVEELQRIVAMNARVRALGSRHSFSDLADTSGDAHLAARHARRDRRRRRCPVRPGVCRSHLRAARLRPEPAGWALGSMASLPHITVAGAVATGTHGSGDGVGSLASAVRALELVDADGQHRTVALGGPDFEGHVVSLGALGIVTHLTLAVEPAFDVRQDVHLGLAWPDLSTTSTRSSPAPTASASSPTGSTPRPPRCG